VAGESFEDRLAPVAGRFSRGHGGLLVDLVITARPEAESSNEGLDP
jgi:hypothetical protein